MENQFEDYPPGGAIEQSFESSRDYNDRSIDWINTKNPQEMSLYQRRMVAGQSFKLPDEPTISDAHWESFKGTFMADISDDVNEKAKSFRYLWEDEDDNPSSTRPAYGIAKDIVQLTKLMETNRVLREDIDYKGHGNENGNPSESAWNNVMKMTSFQAFKVEADESGGTAVEPTNEHHRKIIDAIVNFTTSNYYNDAAVKKHPAQTGTGPHPGSVAQLYFEDYSENVKIMRKAYKCGQVLLTSDLSPNFTAGMYPTYTAVMNAVQRRYNRCRTQDTMVDLFRKLDKVFKDRSPFEFKIGLLRNLLKKIYITDKNEFFVCKDFDDDRNKQRHPEGFTPAVATLLHYISFTKNIDESRWEAIEKEYHHQMNGKPTYRSWHENRQELYKILDEEVKRRKPSINQVKGSDVYNIDADESVDDMSDDDLIAFVRQRRQNFRRANPSKGYKSSTQRRFAPNFRKSYQNQPKPQQKPQQSQQAQKSYRPTNNDKRDGLRKLLLVPTVIIMDHMGAHQTQCVR